MAAGGGGAGTGMWGTWEELVLGAAVVRHGRTAWATVADELRSRSPCAFSPEDCEAKFTEIQLRYSTSNDWYEELRKQRIAELKRDIEKSDNSIRSLHSVIERLRKQGDRSSDCHTTHTESSSHFGNEADINSSSKDLPRDISSSACFTEKASNCQESQQVQQRETDSIQTKNTLTEESFLKAVDAKVYDKESLFWGSRKQRAGRVRRIIQNADSSSRNGEHISTTCIEGGICSEVCKDMKKGLNLEAPNVEPGSAEKGLKTSNAESDAMKNGLKTPNVEPVVLDKGVTTPTVESVLAKNSLKDPKLESGVMKNSLKVPKQESLVMDNLKIVNVDSGVSLIKREKANLTAIVKFISTEGDGLTLQRRVDVLRKRAAYKKIIRQHMNFRIMKSKIKSGAISSTKELLRDMLIFVSNIIVFYPKATLEYKAAIELRDLACKTVNDSANFISKTASASIVKKKAKATQPRRHAPGDAKGNKVASRDATATAMQGEGKDTRTDKPPAAKLKIKIVQKRDHAKNRGVDQPTKSEPSERSAPPP